MTKSIRILVLEDGDWWWNDIREALPDRFQVVFAKESRQAKKEFQAARESGYPFNLILTDLDLSTASGVYAGVDFVQYIRRYDTDVPVVVFSEKELTIAEARMLFVELRVSDAADKQTGLPHLLERIEDALARKTPVKLGKANENAIRSPATILFLAASPVELCRLNLANEVREIQRAILVSGHGDAFVIVQQHEVRITELQELLLRHKPDIVHFAGHGATTNEIVMLDEHDSACVIAPQQMASIFLNHSNTTRCVILNACHTQAQMEAIGQYIDCVIGVHGSITDKAAARFAAMFYMTLGFAKSVKSAFDVGSLQLELEGLAQERVSRTIQCRLNPDEIFFVRS